MEEPPDVVLYNCSSQLLAHYGPLRNVSWAWSLNRTQLEGLLEAVLVDDSLSLEARRGARDLLAQCLFPAQRPFRLPPWQKTAWAVAFALMLAIAVSGNAIVMWIVLGELLPPLHYASVALDVSEYMASSSLCTPMGS
ncbi:hypothetical protein PR048_024873 [Dryococelus australis]|uniref:Uncharacterized protein n=1 Tax=Dryococelus australis TaxID=614101 RepID=A0ABQ9GPU4_9NEOP|nr:hypothetical protein PR048_024873 [Dryococelus australis]